jgi:hypothetical protein
VGPIGRSGQDPAGFEHQWNEWLKLYDDKVKVAKIVFERRARRTGREDRRRPLNAVRVAAAARNEKAARIVERPDRA